jgi:hypothetical protein
MGARIIEALDKNTNYFFKTTLSLLAGCAFHAINLKAKVAQKKA